jgi:hypothetical protein
MSKAGKIDTHGTCKHARDRIVLRLEQAHAFYDRKSLSASTHKPPVTRMASGHSTVFLGADQNSTLSNDGRITAQFAATLVN